jgi:hypothetical protein
MTLLLVIVGLLVAVVVVWALVRFLLMPAEIARYHRDVADLRWTPCDRDADFDVHDPSVADLERHGYRIDSQAKLRIGRTSPAVTLLVHDDLSVAEVATRSDGIGMSITSLLGDGASVLETSTAQDVPAADGRLLQVFPGATVDALVARHQEALAWLGPRGVVPVAHAQGAPGILETSAHILGRAPTPTPAEIGELSAGRSTAHLGPLARQDDVDHQLAAAGLA